MASTIVWLRDDLRLDDNPALAAAASLPDPMSVVYILDEVSPGIRPLGAAAKWWLHHSLAALSADLEARGSRLLLRRGGAAAVIRELVEQTGAGPSIGTDATGSRSVRWTPHQGVGPRRGH
jgi:deoxyribodipyrimidine photo-lyase